VPLGSYTLNVTASGFGPGMFSHVQVVAGNSTAIGKQTLNLGATSQIIEVEGSAAQMLNRVGSGRRGPDAQQWQGRMGARAPPKHLMPRRL